MQWNRHTNRQRDSEPDTSTFQDHVIFVSKMFLTSTSIKNLPITTPTWINAWNIAEAIIGQADKMFRDVRNSKWSRQLSATLVEILVSGENYNGSNLVFSLRILECFAKLQDTATSLLHCSPSQNFCRGNYHCQACHNTLECRLQTFSAFKKTCSPASRAL